MYYSFFKRFFDILFSFIALLLLSPFFIILIIVLLLTGEHKVFFLQERIGKGGKPFRIIKFTTMLKKSPETALKKITVRNDPRVLPVGRFLRKTKINELPQLLNVLTGKMTVIGPRPLTEKGFAFYNETAKHYISKLKPGLTSIGSIIFRDEECYVSMASDPLLFYTNVIFPHKGDLEIWYFNNCSFYVDFMIVFLTLWVIFFPESKLIYRIFKTLPVIDFEKEVG